jgi:hypothetical protein
MSKTSPQPRHRLRKILLTGAAIVVVLIIGVAASSHSKPAASAIPAPTATFTPGSPSTSAKPHVLARFHGSGTRNSPPFAVPGPVSVRYTYDCSSYGQSGNFIAELDEDAPGYDEQQVANELGLVGGQTTTIYPADPGQRYHLNVASECNWRIVVKTR